MKTAVALLALGLLLTVPAAQAQDVEGITLEITSAGTVPFEGSGTFDYSATIGCAELLQSPGESLTVDVSDAPAWLTSTPDEVEVGASQASACLTTMGATTVSGSVEFNVSAAAPAVTQHVVQLVATLGSTSSDPTSATLSVAYVSNYTVVPSVTFPMNLTTPTVQFDVTGTQASNAPSMIMVDSFSACDGALVSGFGALQYDNDAGKPDSKTYTITFTAPTDDWETCSITLKVYGHYNFPDGSAAGDPMDHKTITWELTNGGVSGGDGKESKKSPAPVGLLTALGLLGFAAFARRRQD